MNKKIALLLCIFTIANLLLGTFAVTPAKAAPYNPVLGDLNGDGDVSVADYIVLKNNFQASGSLGSEETVVSDINRDSVISSADILYFKYYFMGECELVCGHSFSEWSALGEYDCLGKSLFTRKCSLCGKIEEESRDEDAAVRSLDGKNVMFIGNSFIYYGYCINNGSQKSRDLGYFYQLCRENGESVNVYDYVWGGRNLDYIYDNYLKDADSSFLETIDYVFMSEAGENNSALVTDVTNIMNLFPSSHTEFYYLCHAYTYQAGHSKITGAFSSLQSKGVDIVNWGELVYDVWTGDVEVPGAKKSYSKTTFIVNKNDTHHQNMLSGYITAQMAYCAITGKSAVGENYLFCTDSSINSKYDPDAYISSYYNSGTTNFDEVFDSIPDMLGLQQLMDTYLQKYGFEVFTEGAHCYSSVTGSAYSAALADAGLAEHKCSLCSESILVETSSSGNNNMYISAETVAAAGVSTVKEYMLAGYGNVFYQTEVGWGRANYSSIQGMASACDGERGSKGGVDGSELYWKAKTLTASLNADGGTAATDEKAYVSLIGYDIKEPISADGMGIFVNKVNAPKAFDILGGKKSDDGTIQWTVLATFDSETQSYMEYDSQTFAYFANFDTAELDCVQIGISSIRTNIFYISEFELYE